jgi:hypothetical protein
VTAYRLSANSKASSKNRALRQFGSVKAAFSVPSCLGSGCHERGAELHREGMAEVKLHFCAHEVAARRCRDPFVKAKGFARCRRSPTPTAPPRVFLIQLDIIAWCTSGRPRLGRMRPDQSGTPRVRPHLTSSWADVWHLYLSLSGELAASRIRLHGFRGYECEY